MTEILTGSHIQNKQVFCSIKNGFGVWLWSSCQKFLLNTQYVKCCIIFILYYMLPSQKSTWLSRLTTEERNRLLKSKRNLQSHWHPKSSSDLYRKFIFSSDESAVARGEIKHLWKHQAGTELWTSAVGISFMLQTWKLHEYVWDARKGSSRADLINTGLVIQISLNHKPLTAF